VRRGRTPYLVLALCLLVVSPAASDTITLTNGRVIDADRAWYEGAEVRYQKDGGIFGLPRDLVQKLEQRAGGGVVLDPDVLRSREHLAAGDPGEALRYARLALFRDPASVPGLRALAQAQLALGDPRRARESAEQAVRLDSKDPAARALLGDVMLALGERLRAEEEYRRSLTLRADPAIEQKLLGLAPTYGDAHFRIRYEGSPRESLGVAVLKILTEAYTDHRKRLSFSPDSPITVVVQTGSSFVETTRAPEWAEGWNDGTIRIPAAGLELPNPRLQQVLRHELAHSFVASRTGNNCPVWLQEGIAQWLEGGDPAREDLMLVPLARTGRLPNLLTLEGPFRGLTESQAGIAYAQSLSAVAHILRKRGEAGLLRFVAALSDRLPAEEALPVSIAFSYPEFQKSWEDHLKVAETRPLSAAPLQR
jgi:tetratricopeptide (TPR) repeat protein